MPLGPTFRFTTALGANATVRPLQDQAWIYRVLPFAAIVYLAVESVNAGVVMTFSAGSDVQAGPDQPVQAGAVAGVFQSDVELMDQYLGGAGDELQLVIRNTLGVASAINVLVRLQPA